MTRRNSGKDLGSIIAELNRALRGFITYSGSPTVTRVMQAVDGWLRRRLSLRTAENSGRRHRACNRATEKLGSPHAVSV